MPEDFIKCVNEGGIVRTVKPKPGYYQYVCFDKKGAKHSGEVKKDKEKK